MKKLYLVLVAISVNIMFYACTPEAVCESINGIVCCDEEGTFPPPPPPQEPGANDQ